MYSYPTNAVLLIGSVCQNDESIHSKYLKAAHYVSPYIGPLMIYGPIYGLVRVLWESVNLKSPEKNVQTVRIFFGRSANWAAL